MVVKLTEHLVIMPLGVGLSNAGHVNALLLIVLEPSIRYPHFYLFLGFQKVVLAECFNTVTLLRNSLVCYLSTAFSGQSFCRKIVVMDQPDFPGCQDCDMILHPGNANAAQHTAFY